MIRRWAFAWAWFIGAVLVACHPNPPTPPTPPPQCPEACPAGQACVDPKVGCVPITITTNLIRRDGPKFTADGQPFTPFPLIPCCMSWQSDAGGAPPGWPMIGAKVVDDAQAMANGPLKPNWFELRPGPFCSTCEPEYPGIGSYTGDTVSGGPNPILLSKLDEQVIHVGQSNGVAMVTLVDCWYCRAALPHPWNGTPAKAECGAKMDAVQSQWIEAVVKAVGRHHNVVWLTGNECDIMAGNDGTWEASVIQIVRKVESDMQFPVHVIGVQSKKDVTQQGAADYVVFHTGMPIDSPRYNKPTMVLEFNPEPPYTADIMNGFRCRAQQSSTYWAAWRHTIPWADFQETIKRFSSGSCTGVDTSECPAAVKPTTNIKCKPFGTHGICDGRPCPAYDCTPNTGGGPVWPEGSDLRWPCEQKSMGGVPSMSIAAPLRIDHMIHNGMGFAVGGHGSAKVTCSIPNQPAGWRGCLDTAGNPLVVSIP